MWWKKGNYFRLIILVILLGDSHSSIQKMSLLFPQRRESVAYADVDSRFRGNDSLRERSEYTLFANVSRAAGIVNTRRGNGRSIGQAWGDYNGDGWIDFYVTDNNGPNTLFRNNGNGTFSVSSLAEIVALPDAFSGGASFVDYDNDGWRDLYVVNWGANVLFHNEGGQGFVDVTEQAGVGNEANGQTASWGDYDNDGFLDLYVANWSCYPKCGRPFTGESDRLYHNDGDGSFTDVSHFLKSKRDGAGFVASFTDYDNDGDQDIYLVNDEFIYQNGNALWRNDGPGCDADTTVADVTVGHCFTEVSTEAGADTQVMGMGLATADYDNDGDFDFYFSNAGPMTLLQNQGDGTFQDVAQRAGVDVPKGIAWGTTALDYDNDGWQDLYVAVMTTADHRGIPANPLFHNNGDGTFTRVSSGSGASDVGPTMGVATADYDQDGWVDLLIGNKDNGYSLLRNQTGEQIDHHWLTLELIGGGPINRDAVGARVTIQIGDGVKQMREVQNGSSLGAGNELALHFGLGTAVSISKLTVQWPNGRIQHFENIPADQRVILSYPEQGDHKGTLLQNDNCGGAALCPPSSSAQPAEDDHKGTPLQNVLRWILEEWKIIVGSISVIAILLLTVAVVKSDQIVLLNIMIGLLGILIFGTIWALVNMQSKLASPNSSLDHLLARANVTLPERLPEPTAARVALGEALFWDPILSGNKDISCATCHHPSLAMGDDLSTSIGTGGEGLGRERTLGKRRELIPRNATAVYNLGLVGMDVMFWDGRVEGTAETGFDSPANDDLPFGLETAVAVQAMFPVTSPDEMRGKQGDKDIFGERNLLANLNEHEIDAVWDSIMARLLAIPAYQQLFKATYPNIQLNELGFEHAANALADYQMAAFTFLGSPWDRYLQGDGTSISPAALEGAQIFYGKAGCATCHSGALMSDMQFHNLGVPQVGPGKGFEEPLDYGRARETGDEQDLFAFRTPPLRNVAITGPWMHNGAYSKLETAVRHHLNPAATYDTTQLSPLMLAAGSDDLTTSMAALNESSVITPTVNLSDQEVSAILAFLESLTSPSATNLNHTIPEAVPSGLQVGGQ